MRISRRTSGGRGEYEISEDYHSLGPRDLIGKRIVIDLPDGITVDTNVIVVEQGGKIRLRLIDKTKDIHIHRQVAALLLMPAPAREDRAFGRSMPILKRQQYAIQHIEIEAAISTTDIVHINIKEIELCNLNLQAEILNYAQRLVKTRQLWGRASDLPLSKMRDLVEEHMRLVHSGAPIPRQAEICIAQLQSLVSEYSTELELFHRTPEEDVLDSCLRLIDYAVETASAVPDLRPEDLDPEDTVIKMRTEHQWRRYVNARGSSTFHFRKLVRKAYNFTCIICGLRFPRTRFNAIPGVDAAHILPWSEYDLDNVNNGLCLCRHHHWAFDEGLLEIGWNEPNYEVRIPEHIKLDLVQDSEDFSIDELARHEGVISVDRLPRRRAEWPSPVYLEELRRSRQ